MSTDAQPAASSAAVADAPIAVTAVDQAVVSNDVAAYREARRAERAGKPLTPPADSSPAQPGQQAASTEVNADPASEAGKPRRNADTRVQELLADRARERERADRLERELSELRRPSQAPDATPAAPSAAPATKAIVYPPNLQSFDTYVAANPDGTYDDYTDARADFRFEAKSQAEKAAQQQAREQTETAKRREAQGEKFRQQVDAAKASEPDFLEKISPDVLGLKTFDDIRDAQGRWTEKPSGYHAIASEILGSDVAPQLMRHFTDHPEELHRLAKLMPAQLLKEFGVIERSVTKATPAATPPKTVSDAPTPPTTLGTRPHVSANPVDAAVAAGDVAAYRAARLRERVANQR